MVRTCFLVAAMIGKDDDAGGIIQSFFLQLADVITNQEEKARELIFLFGIIRQKFRRKLAADKASPFVNAVGLMRPGQLVEGKDIFCAAR